MLRNPNKQARKLLDEIVKFVNQADAEAAEHLWNILTALRGPDDDTFTVKAQTTERIRSIIGLRDGSTFTVGHAKLTATALQERRSQHHHFNSHYRRAVKSIAALYRYDLDTEAKIG